MKMVNRGLSYTTLIYIQKRILQYYKWYLLAWSSMVPDNHATPVTTQHLLNWRLRTAAHTTNQSRLFAWNSSLLATSLTSTCSNSEYTEQGSLTRISHERKVRIDCRIPIYPIDSPWFRFGDDATSQLIKTYGYEIGISIKSEFKLEIFNISQYVFFFQIKIK